MGHGGAGDFFIFFFFCQLVDVKKEGIELPRCRASLLVARDRWRWGMGRKEEREGEEAEVERDKNIDGGVGAEAEVGVEAEGERDTSIEARAGAEAEKDDDRSRSHINFPLSSLWYAGRLCQSRIMGLSSDWEVIAIASSLLNMTRMPPFRVQVSIYKRVCHTLQITMAWYTSVKYLMTGRNTQVTP